MVIKKAKQSRWRGDTKALIALAKDAADTVHQRTGGEPVLLATFYSRGEDEERHEGFEKTESALNGLNARQLEQLQAIKFEVGRRGGAAVTLRATVGADTSLIEFEVGGGDPAATADLRSALVGESNKEGPSIDRVTEI